MFVIAARLRRRRSSRRSVIRAIGLRGNLEHAPEHETKRERCFRNIEANDLLLKRRDFLAPPPSWNEFLQEPLQATRVARRDRLLRGGFGPRRSRRLTLGLGLRACRL